jgi:pantetheine-phosphate adenylyltransferase
MMPSAVFPGSFDPFTIGHADIVQRALPLFNHIYIALGNNSAKSPLMTPEERKHHIAQYYAANPKISVVSYSGLTTAFCKSIGAQVIIRGLRSSNDFEFEQSIAQMNQVLPGEIETLFLMCRPEHAHISSTIIRDIIRNGGDASNFII